MAALLDRRRLLAWLGIGPAVVVARPAKATRAPVRVLLTRVNGEHYHGSGAALATLAEGQTVHLRREPTNAHDRRAIEVLAADGRKLGYVARADNSAVARMMDAGERFEARTARLDRAEWDIRLEVDWLPA